MKKTAVILVIVSLLMSFMLCSCGDNSGDNGKKETTTSATETTKTMTEIGEEAAKARECQEDPAVFSATDIMDNYGIGQELYSDFYYSLAGDFVSIETIAIFKAADGKAEEIENKLKAVKQSLESQSKNYNENNYQMAINAKIKNVDGKYVYMVVSSKVDDIVKVIDKYI